MREVHRIDRVDGRAYAFLDKLSAHGGDVRALDVTDLVGSNVAEIGVDHHEEHGPYTLGMIVTSEPDGALCIRDTPNAGASIDVVCLRASVSWQVVETK